LRPIRDAIDDLDFPFVISDAAGHPFLWNTRQTGVALPPDVDLTELLSVDLARPDPRTAELRRLMRRFDAQRPPIELRSGGDVVMRLHYGRGRLSRQLFWLPLLEAILILTFMGLALVAFRNMKRSEQRSVWVGMAKETAHQMGTPLTSLSGWLALLGESGPGGRYDRAEILREIGNDVDRLAKVSARFSQIGSRTQLRSGPPDEVLRKVCAYFRRRLPIREEIAPLPQIPLASELLDWAIENLVKNALDAIDKPHGLVTVSGRHLAQLGRVEILVRDNGKGMSPSVQRRVFDAGFTTKERGWGMGLALVRRIVEEVHGGRIRVLHSSPGQGTTMQILLPTA
jgi:signal transduction histidine kinase